MNLLQVSTVDPAGWARQTLISYRYLSWALTSAFYLVGPPASPAVFKLGVVLALLIAGRLAIHLYFGNGITQANTVALAAVEAIGIAVLLLPTGGFDSPFIWYALNPIVMAASFLPGVYCWSILGGFLVAVSGADILFAGGTTGVLAVVEQESWLLLVFLLVTAVSQLFARLIRKLQDAYEDLTEAHAATQHSLQHISSLYQALEAFSAQEDTGRLARLLASYALRLGGYPAACLLVSVEGDEQCNPVTQVETATGNSVPDIDWDAAMISLWRGETEQGEKDRSLVSIPIRSLSQSFGLLACVVPPGAKADEKTLRFLADLGAVVLERFTAERLWARLLVSEEQNRIANEIHDGVAQHLFSIAFAVHALAQKEGRLQDVRPQLELIKKTANQAARELRASIYRISPQHRGEQIFVAGLSSHLKGMAELNGVKVDLRAEGSEDTLSPALRKAFYRIVREATANAIRHGRCSHIDVFLKMIPGKAVLQVIDDGVGFDPAAGNNGPRGLGLANMGNLMVGFGGSFDIRSQPGKGTTVACAVPAEHRFKGYPAMGGGGVESRCG